MHAWHTTGERPKPGAPIAAFDYDETLGRGVIHWKFGPHLANLGVILNPQEDEELINMRLGRHRRERQYKDYEERLIELSLKYYADAKVSRGALAGQAKSFVAQASILEEQYAFPRALFQVLKELGYALVLISWGPTELIHPLAERMGFHHAIGNLMETNEEGIFTGQDGRLPIKEQDMLAVVEEFGYSLNGSVAIGDSGTDLGMLRLATTGIAFNPKVSLRKKLDEDLELDEIIRVTERAEIVTFTRPRILDMENERIFQEEKIENVLPGSLAEPIRTKLEAIGYYLF